MLEVFKIKLNIFLLCLKVYYSPYLEALSHKQAHDFISEVSLLKPLTCRWQCARLWRDRIEGYIRWIGNRAGSWQGRTERAEWTRHGTPVTRHRVDAGQGDSTYGDWDSVPNPEEANVADKLKTIHNVIVNYWYMCLVKAM